MMCVAYQRLGRAIGEAGQLHDQRVGQRVRTECVRDPGDALAADQRDFHGAAVLRLRDERDDAGVDEVGVLAAGAHRTEHGAALQRMRIEVLHQLLEDLPVRFRQLGEHVVVNPVSEHAGPLY